MSVAPGVRTMRPHHILTAAVGAAIVFLSGCAGAPGMHMSQSAATPAAAAAADTRDPANAANAANAANDAADSASPALPLHEIDFALIGQLNDEAVQNGGVEPQLLTTPGAYTLGVGDVLQITVWDHPELVVAQGAQSQAQARAADAPAGFVVDQDGAIAFPYAGNLSVAGLRVDEVRAQLVSRLARMFREPQVTVRVASYRAKKIYIDGEVHTPGVQPINDIPMTLVEAITRAGGFTAAADQSRMQLVRNGVAYPLDLPRMLAGKLSPSKLMLQDGDLLRVVSRDENGVFVMGEINRPTTAVPLKNGVLTLSDALSQAGSLNTSTANAAQMYVIRGGGQTPAQVFHLDGSSPVSMMLANQFALQPKDVVYVDATGLARFSRVLSQLLPAINAGLTAALVTR